MKHFGLQSNRRRLGLPGIPWEGGNRYYTVNQSGPRMSRAEAMGWGSANFFPIAVWLSDPNHASALANIGINTYFGIFGNPGAINTAAAAGMSIIPQANEWTPAEVNAETSGRDNVVGWTPIDEPELNTTFAAYSAKCAELRALNDGRFLNTNFAHSVRRTVWWVANSGEGQTEFFDGLKKNDVACVDQYCYTSPGIRGDVGPQGICDNFNFPDLHNGTAYLWPGAYQDEAKVKQAAAYGWQAKVLRAGFTEQGIQAPVWVTVESQMPYITESGRSIIKYEEIRGAVYSALINEARGIMYFQHNGFYDQDVLGPGNPPDNYSYNGGNDPNTGAPPNEATMSLVDGDLALRNYVGALNAQIHSLAPVLNTQSLVWNFGASGIETMLKAKDGFAYIFAAKSVMGTTGVKTFSFTGSGIKGTDVEVIGESRNLTIGSGTFQDNFANEATVHIYKVAI